MELIRGRTRSEGFTLIELLVVVAIITLLIAILIPSLGKARDRAKVTSCASNLKQIYYGCEAYASDNGDKYPDLYVTLGYHPYRVAPGMTYGTSSLPEIYGLPAVLDGLNKIGGNGFDDRIGPSYFVSRSKAWICPAHAPTEQALLNTYQTAPNNNYALYKMDQRTAFKSNAGTVWVQDLHMYKPADSAVLGSTTYMNANLRKNAAGKADYIYPHKNNGYKAFNMLTISGEVYLNDVK